MAENIFIHTSYKQYKVVLVVSKAAMMLKMITMLQSRGKMKIKDIAKELEVNDRSVRQYKNELDQAEIYINSVRGVDGGYILDKKTVNFNLKLNKEEFAALKMAQAQINKDRSYIFQSELDLAMDKIDLALKNHDNDINDNKCDFILESRPNVNVSSEKEKMVQLYCHIR